MSLPNVNITLANGTLGQTLQTADGVCGMVLVGVSEGSIVQGTPFTVISLADAQSKGLTQANNPIAFKEITEFFNEAGTGSTLYLLLVANTMTVDEMADQTNANGAVKLLDFAAGKIRLLGVMDDPSAYTPTITNGLNANVATAKTNMQTLATTYFNKQWPFRAVIAGENFSGTSTALTDETSAAQNRVAILIGDTVASTNRAAIGLLLGRLSVIPVQRKVSRVKTGPLSISTAFIVATDVAQYTTTSTIHDRGYITIRTFANKSGYYFTGDPTCTTTTDDYRFVARGRVIDKAQILAYATYVEEIDNEVLINTDGTLNAGYCKFMEQTITNQLNLIMKANNEISSAKCFVDPTQNVLATNQVNVVLKIIPVGYSNEINVTLGFDNPNS
jgi:hypothetical protein